jgi:hypothetical protein
MSRCNWIHYSIDSAVRPQTPTTEMENHLFFVRQLPCGHVWLRTSLIITAAAGESSIQQSMFNRIRTPGL